MGGTDLKPFLYGGLASMTAELGTFPIDTTKTRLQLQGQTGTLNATVKYNGMLHTAFLTSKEEGLLALYRGIQPALLRQATYGTMKMGIYKMIKSKLIETNNGASSLSIDIISGIIAGVISSSIANPTDVVKVRLQAQNQQQSRRSIRYVIKDIHRKEGIRGYWKGVVPTAQRACLITSAELPAYDSSKRFFLSRDLFKDNVYLHFMCSCIAGFFGAVVSNPIDVIKTRVMNESDNSKNSGVLNCIKQTLKHEGKSGFYKGFIPNYMRLAPWNVMFFMSYEQFSKFDKGR